MKKPIKKALQAVLKILLKKSTDIHYRNKNDMPF